MRLPRLAQQGVVVSAQKNLGIAENATLEFAVVHRRARQLSRSQPPGEGPIVAPLGAAIGPCPTGIRARAARPFRTQDSENLQYPGAEDRIAVLVHHNALLGVGSGQAEIQQTRFDAASLPRSPPKILPHARRGLGAAAIASAVSSLP
jgi:hypothetical protein